MVVAIDGTKIFGSYNLQFEILTTEIKGKPYYYHCGAVMSVVGNGPKIVQDYEMYKCIVDSTKKDEGEINVSKRLLSRVLGIHKNFVDIVTLAI